MDNPNFGVSLGERLGGRWAISWQTLAIGTPLAVAALVVGAADQTTVLIWIGIGVVAVLGGGASWSYFMHRTVFRNRDMQPVSLPWVVVGTSVSAALFVGLAIALGMWMGVLDTDELWVQFVPLFVVIVTWALLIPLVLDSQWRYRVHRDALIQQSVQQQLASAQESDVLAHIRDSVRREAGEELRATQGALIARIDGLAMSEHTHAAELAQELRDVARTSVRSLSHELEMRARRSHRTPGIFASLRNIVRTQPFRPLAVSVIYAVTSTSREIADFGAMIGIVFLGTVVALLFGIMTPLNLAMRRWARYHTAIYLCGLVIIQIPTILLAPLREQITDQTLSMDDLLISVVFGTIIVVSTSAFGSVNRSRIEVLEDFRKEVDRDTIATLARSEAIAAATMDVAVTLHGSVQSQLNACAVAIENAARQGDMVELNRALMQARAILDNPVLPLTEPVDTSLCDAISERTTQWRGLVEVRVSIDSGADSITGPLAKHLTDVVEEAIANAVHHGSATAVDIHIRADGTAVEVTVIDNGSGTFTGSPGFGSRLFTQFAGEWTLTRTDSDTVLAVRVPLAVVN